MLRGEAAKGRNLGQKENGSPVAARASGSHQGFSRGGAFWRILVALGGSWWWLVPISDACCWVKGEIGAAETHVRERGAASGTRLLVKLRGRTFTRFSWSLKGLLRILLA